MSQGCWVYTTVQGTITDSILCSLPTQWIKYIMGESLMENVLYLYDIFNSAKYSVIMIWSDRLPEAQNTLFTSTDSSDSVRHVCPQMVCYPEYKNRKSVNSPVTTNLSQCPDNVNIFQILSNPLKSSISWCRLEVWWIRLCSHLIPKREKKCQICKWSHIISYTLL